MVNEVTIYGSLPVYGHLVFSKTYTYIYIYIKFKKHILNINEYMKPIYISYNFFVIFIYLFYLNFLFSCVITLVQ